MSGQAKPKMLADPTESQKYWRRRGYINGENQKQSTLVDVMS